MRDMLFISHATPVDNDFAVWLATKLELHGYKVWIDVNSLNPAADFWNTIETTIREQTVKFIFVATKNSTTRDRDGVEKELAIADRTRRAISEEFIVPVRADDVSYNNLPSEIIRQNVIDFNGNWAKGLKDLIDYLDKCGVPRCNKEIDSYDVVERWLNLKATITNKPICKDDYYYSNVFPATIPKYLFAYRTNEVEQTFSDNHFTRKKIKDVILTFVCPDCVQDVLGKDIDYEQFNVDEILSNKPDAIYTLDCAIKAPAKLCIELLNRSICDFFFINGMRKVNFTDKTSRQVYFFRLGTRTKRSENSRTVSLAGKRKENYWHYALSAHYVQYPVSAYIVKWHLVFTDSKGNLLPQYSQISARRSKGKTFYNKQWLNLLKASMYYLSKGKKQIFVNPCCGKNTIEISSIPICYISNIGYVEPNAERVDDDDE